MSRKSHNKRNHTVPAKKKDESPKKKSPELDTIVSTFYGFYLRQKSSLYLLEHIENMESDFESRFVTGMRNVLPDYSKNDLKKIVEQFISLQSKIDRKMEDSGLAKHKANAKKLEKYLNNLPEEVQAALVDNQTVEELFRYPEENILLNSLLVTLISDLDAYIASSMTLIYERTNHSMKLLNDSDHRYTWEEISTSSAEEIKTRVIEEHVRRKMGESFTNQIETLKKLGCNFPDNRRNHEMNVYYLVRNRFVHANGICDKATYDALQTIDMSAGIGEQIQLSDSFIRDVADSTLDIAFQLLVSLGDTLIPEEDQGAFEDYLTNRLYYMLQLNRFSLVRRLADRYAHTKFRRDYGKQTIMVNGWIAAKALGEFENVRGDVER
jgi:hypothetical protein